MADPMTADVQQELAEALPESLTPVGARLRYPEYFGEPEPLTGYGKQIVAALLPTVQALIADAEKRAAAGAAAYAYEQGYDACRHGEQRRNPYRARAAALDPT